MARFRETKSKRNRLKRGETVVRLRDHRIEPERCSEGRKANLHANRSRVALDELSEQETSRKPRRSEGKADRRVRSTEMASLINPAFEGAFHFGVFEHALTLTLKSAIKPCLNPASSFLP